MTLRSIGRFCCCLALSSALIATEGRSQAVTDQILDTQWRAVQTLSPGEFVEVRLLKKATVSGSIVSSMKDRSGPANWLNRLQNCEDHLP